MKKTCIFCIVFALFFYSCRQNNNHTNTSRAEKNDTTKFFQVSEFLKKDIAEVNQTPYFIYKITVVNGKRDSVAVNNDVFNRISAQFRTPDINDSKLKKHYTEAIFHDQTTKSFTMSYTTPDKDLEIQNIEVLLREDGETVKRIFMRKFLSYPDSSAIEQLSWKPGQSFQINRLVQKNNNKENSYQTNIVWNEKSKE